MDANQLGMWNYFELIHQFALPVFADCYQAPEVPGYYMLFGAGGNFIYVGKADNLRERLLDHINPGEPNFRIAQFATYAIWVVTKSVAKAKQSEGEVFDKWVRATGKYPFANQIQPPKATVTLEEMRRIKIRNLLNLYLRH